MSFFDIHSERRTTMQKKLTLIAIALFIAAIAFVLFLITSCFPSFADSELAEIGAVEISNINTDLDPDEVPSFTTEATPSDKLTITEEVWHSVNDLVPDGTEKPVPAATYTYRITLEAAEGYCFAKPFSFTYNGTELAEGDFNVSYRKENTKVTISGFVDVYIPYTVPFTTVVDNVTETKQYVDTYFIDGSEVTETEYLSYKQSHGYKETVSVDFSREISRTLTGSETAETDRTLETDSEGQQYWLVYYTQTDSYDVVSEYARVHNLISNVTPSNPKRIDFVAVTNINKALKKDETPAYTAVIQDLTYSSGASLRDRISVTNEKWTGPNTLEEGSDAKAEVGTYNYEITIKAADGYFFDGDPFEFYNGGRDFDYADLDVTYPDATTAVIKGILDPVTVTDTSGGGGGNDPIVDPDPQTQTVTNVVHHDNVTKQYEDRYYIGDKETNAAYYESWKSSHAYKETTKTSFVKELSRELTSTTTTLTETRTEGNITIYYYTRDEYYDVTEQYLRTHTVTSNDSGSGSGQGGTAGDEDEPSGSGNGTGSSTDEQDDAASAQPGTVAPDMSAKAADKAITTANTEEIAGTEFSTLRAKQGKVTKSAITVKWSAASGAAKYIVYGNRCGTANRYQKLGETGSLSFAQAGLKKGTYHKFIVVAVNSQGKVIAASKSLHITTKGGKNGNVTKVTVKKPKKLKVGKSFKLKAKQKGKKVRKHRKICYESTDSAVATVTSGGKIKAVSKGTCYVYAYAQNGMYKRVKVTVK